MIRKSLLEFLNLINENFEREIVNIFLTHLTVLTYVLGAQKNRLMERVLLSTHNKCLVEKSEN